MKQENKQIQEPKQKFVALELSAIKIEQLSKQPVIESSIKVSEDGKWAIHKTIITDLKPFSYYEKVLGN